VEPTEVQSLLIPRTVCSKTSKPELCFVNVTDKNIILHRGQEIATVEEAQVLCAETQSKTPKTRVSKKTDTITSMSCGGGHLGFPIHIKNRNLVKDLPMIIYLQFGFSQFISFREEDL
jgi:hypothetical protein